MASFFKKRQHSSRDGVTTKSCFSSPGMYSVIALFMFFCTVWIAVNTFAPEPHGVLSEDCPCRGVDQCICARETVEALTAFQLFCLANSRVAAYMLYPLYLIMFLSMARNLSTYLHHTILAEFIPFTSTHSLHFWAGTMIGVVIMWHALWHLIRWGVQDNLAFLAENQTGVTGLIAVLITPLLVWPMRLQKLRKLISFETRKRAHYLSWVWAVALCLHAPAQNVFWIVGSAAVIYLADWIYGLFQSTHLARSARFVRLESAVMIRVLKPEGFSLKGSGGYCYLCVPWIAKYEWHAFSIYIDPVDVNYVCFCISIAGDWTQLLHEEVHEPIYRRLWIYGPFVSPFENADVQDNTISIASGIGITPALSVIKSLADTRKMHLIWICRDASLLEFMLDYGAKFDEDAYTFIFYTGERELVFRRKIPYNVFLLKGRPDLDKLITTLVHATGKDDGTNVSEYVDLDDNVEDIENVSLSVEHQFYTEMIRLLLTYSVEELFNAAVRRSHLNQRLVCFDGLKALMKDLFIRKFSDDQLMVVFNRVDEDKSGNIHFLEFKRFIEQMEENAKKESKLHRPDLDRSHGQVHRQIRGGHAAANNNLQVSSGEEVEMEDDSCPNESVNMMHDPDQWRLMYCGGSSQVVEMLREISKKKKIPLSLESFEW